MPQADQCPDTIRCLPPCHTSGAEYCPIFVHSPHSESVTWYWFCLVYMWDLSNINHEIWPTMQASIFSVHSCCCFRTCAKKKASNIKKNSTPRATEAEAINENIEIRWTRGCHRALSGIQDMRHAWHFLYTHEVRLCAVLLEKITPIGTPIHIHLISIDGFGHVRVTWLLIEKKRRNRVLLDCQ